VIWNRRERSEERKARKEERKASSETKKRGMFIENFVIILILKLADKNIHNLDCYSEEEYSKY